MKKRILALALAAIMLMVPFTACSSSSSSTPAASASAAGTGSSSPASAEPDNSPITLTVLNRVNAEIVLDDNPMLAAVAEKTGVTLEIEAPPISNYTDRLQLVMASGDLPDIIYTWEFDQNYEKWANDGLILPLDEYIEDYPNPVSYTHLDVYKRQRHGFFIVIASCSPALPRGNLFSYLFLLS